MKGKQVVKDEIIELDITQAKKIIKKTHTPKAKCKACVGAYLEYINNIDVIEFDEDRRYYFLGNDIGVSQLWD